MWPSGVFISRQECLGAPREPLDRRNAMNDHSRYIASAVRGAVTAVLLIAVTRMTTNGWWTLVPYTALGTWQIAEARRDRVAARIAVVSVLVAFFVASIIVYAYISTALYATRSSKPFGRQVWPFTAAATIGIRPYKQDSHGSRKFPRARTTSHEHDPRTRRLTAVSALRAAFARDCCALRSWNEARCKYKTSPGRTDSEKGSARRQTTE